MSRFHLHVVLAATLAALALAGCGSAPKPQRPTVWADSGSRGGPCDDERTLATVSRGAPVCTLARAAAIVPDGGVVLVRAGSYGRLTVSKATKRGTTFKAYGGERPSVAGITATATASGQRFEGLRITDVTLLHGRHLQLVGNELTPHGVVMTGDHDLAEGNDVHDLTIAFDPDRRLDPRRCTAEWRTPAEGGSNADADGDGAGDVPLTTTGGIAPRCGYGFRVQGDHQTIRGNRIANVPADAVQAYRTRDLTVAGNTIDGVEPTVDPLEHSDGLQLIGTNERTVIRDNVWRNTRGVLSMVFPNRDPAKVTQPHDVLISDNVFYNDRNLRSVGNGCLGLSAGTAIVVRHNTCWAAPGVSRGGGIRLSRSAAPARLEATVVDNLTGELRIGAVDDLAEDRNVVSEYQREPGGEDFVPGTADVTGTPTFVSGDPLLRLAPGSLGAGAGVPPDRLVGCRCRAGVPSGRG